MAIATIGGEAGPVHRPLDESDPARTGRSDASRTTLACTAANPLQPAPDGAAPSWALAASPPFYRAMPASTAFATRPEAIAPAVRGYAGAASAPKSQATTKGSGITTSKSTGSKSTAKSTASKSSTPRELAFLDDKHTSIEDKLFQFMTLMTQKNDQELVDAMKEYEGKKAAAQSKASGSSDTSSASSQVKPAGDGHGSSGSGLFGLLGDALGGIGKTVVGGAESLVKDLGGPVLAGVATAVGLPFLAPIALQVGGDLGAGIIEGVASSVGLGKNSVSVASSGQDSGGAASSSGGSTAKSSTTSSAKTSTTSSAKSSSTATAGEFDEKLEMFKLQRLVEKQNAMFSALTNAMKAMHDSQMTAVQNIR